MDLLLENKWHAARTCFEPVGYRGRGPSNDWLARAKVKPGETAESVTYVNRVLAFIFATDESFDQPLAANWWHRRQGHSAMSSPALLLSS